MMRFHDPKPPSQRGGDPVPTRHAGIAPWGSEWGVTPADRSVEAGFPALATARLLLRVSYGHEGITESATIALEDDRAIAARTSWAADADVPSTWLEESGAQGVLPLILDSFPDDALFRMPPSTPDVQPVPHTLPGWLRGLAFDETQPVCERAARMEAAGVSPEVVDAVCSGGVTAVVALELRDDPRRDEPDDQWIAMWTRGERGLYAISFEPVEGETEGTDTDAEAPRRGTGPRHRAGDPEPRGPRHRADVGSDESRSDEPGPDEHRSDEPQDLGSDVLLTVVRRVPAGDVAQQLTTRIALALDHIAELDAILALRRRSSGAGTFSRDERHPES